MSGIYYGWICPCTLEFTEGDPRDPRMIPALSPRPDEFHVPIIKENRHVGWTLDTRVDSTKVRIERLWQSATDYQNALCDANGVSACIGRATMGLLTGNPNLKALANINWWQGIWDDYAARKIAAMRGEVVSFDFSGHGTLPYPISDL